MTDYWADELGSDFRPEAALVTFTGQTQTGCGGATSQVGPFYCPSDQTIYLDTTFFQDVLQQQLNGPAGAFVEPYVLAHEYGHHIQNLLGTMGRVRTQQGPRSDAVRLELQADCYAGMWTKNATSTTDSGGEALITRAEPAGHPGGDRGRQERRRRPHPAADAGPGLPRVLDPRLGRVPDEVVHDRLRPGLAPGVRHLGGRHPLIEPSSASICGNWRCIARRYGATLGWRYFPASAPSPWATRASAHSARLSTV